MSRRIRHEAMAVAAPRTTGADYWYTLFVAVLVILLGLAPSLLVGCATAGGGGGGPAAGDSMGGDETEDPVEGALREIEEADIVKYDDGFFYLANRYKGLLIVDAQTIERPVMAGGVTMQGRSVELYVDDDRAMVVTAADFFTCAGAPVSFDDEELAEAFLEPDYEGSRITVVDVSDREAPVEISHFDLDGFVTATRRVGDVVYAVGNFEGYDELPDDGDEPPDDGDDDDDDFVPPPSTTGAASEVDEDGEAGASATSPAGFRAAASVSGGEPGRFVQVTAADGNLLPAADGLLDGVFVSGTARIDTDLDEGTHTTVVRLFVPAETLDGLELITADLRFYQHDAEAGLYLPAGVTDLGEVEPTETVGDVGYYPLEDSEELAFWAVVDRLGTFAIGLAPSDELTLNIGEAVGGTVTVDPEQETYDYATVVTLTATAEEGYRFVEWSPTPPGGADPTAETIEVLLTENLSLTPVFEEIDPAPFGPHVFVVSINIADPENIQLVDRVAVAGDSLDIQVTTEAIYVLGDDPTMAATTRVTYVDISDPAGDVELRDSFRVPGTIDNRYFANADGDVLRIITEDRSVSPYTPVVALYSYDVSNPDDVTRLGQLTIETGVSLRSVRFAGTLAYAATFQQDDPLFVLDLSDPTEPIVAGETEAPGWSTHLVPLENDRLLAVGFDDRKGFRPGVMLYDMSDPTRPDRTSWVILGDKWTFDTSSEATIDERALKVLEDEGLILMPFSVFSEDEGRYVDTLQLIEMKQRVLYEQDFIEHRGLIRRAGMTDGRMWILSDEAFQVADVDDRTDVQSVANLDVMSEQELLDTGLKGCADSARFHGFELLDIPFYEGGPIVLPGGGFCGAAGMLGVLLLPMSLLAMKMGRRGK